MTHFPPWKSVCSGFLLFDESFQVLVPHGRSPGRNRRLPANLPPVSDARPSPTFTVLKSLVSNFMCVKLPKTAECAWRRPQLGELFYPQLSFRERSQTSGTDQRLLTGYTLTSWSNNHLPEGLFLFSSHVRFELWNCVVVRRRSATESSSAGMKGRTGRTWRWPGWTD